MDMFTKETSGQFLENLITYFEYLFIPEDFSGDIAEI